MTGNSSGKQQQLSDAKMKKERKKIKKELRGVSQRKPHAALVLSPFEDDFN
jgi:hypothetical protein